MARQRMIVLYDRSVTWGGLVVGTGNKTESLIGYTTIFGDNACAFNPIGDLYKSQVRQVSAAIGVPDAIIRKAPSADLWPGQTDETEAGLQLSRARSPAVLADRQAALGRRGRGARVRAERWSSGSTGWSPAAEFKRQVPPIAKLGPRTAGRRLPLPASTAGVGAGVTADDASATRPDRSAGPLYVVATPIGNLAT